ncbi:MAG: hypothetical protein JWR48_7098, partial [Mycobacterium sp.]|nr:hypothetical protein [Mycobacterium sp.]
AACKYGGFEYGGLQVVGRRPGGYSRPKPLPYGNSHPLSTHRCQLVLRCKRTGEYCNRTNEPIDESWKDSARNLQPCGQQYDAPVRIEVVRG